jgi:hypothetical protein
MCGHLLDFLRQIVNPILNRYWSLFPEFVHELRRLISSDERKHDYFEDYGVLEKYLKCEFRDHWRYFKEKYEDHAEMIDKVFVEILRDTARYIETLKEAIEAIIRDETEEVERLIIIVEEDEEPRPLSGVKIELWLQDKLLNEFITDEKGIGRIKLRPREKRHVSSIKVVISKDGYEGVTIPLTLLNDCIALKRKRGTIRIKVIGDELKHDGAIEKSPVTNCSVSVIKRFLIVKEKGIEITEEKVEACASTYESGIVEFRLPFGEYEIRIESKDFEPKMLPLNLDRDLIEREIELERKRFEYLYVIVNKRVGDTLLYEPIKGCKVLQVKGVLDGEGAEEFDVPFIQLEKESDNRGRITIKSESDFDFDVHWQYKVRVSVPVNGKHVEVNGEGRPPIIKVLLLVKPEVPEEVLCKLNKLSKGDLSEVDPHEFVEIIKWLLTILGYKNIKVTDGPHDEGIDLVCIKEGSKVIVQCKRWKKPVESRNLREFVGTMVSKRANGIFITTSSLTKDARVFVRKIQADGLKVEIFDNARLKYLLRSLKDMTLEPS